MKRHLAIFKSGLGTEMIGDETWVDYNDGEYVRQSEYIDIQFVPRDQSEIVPEQVSMLKTAKEKLHEQYLEKTAQIDEKIAKLLAITHQVDATVQPEQGRVQGDLGIEGNE